MSRNKVPPIDRFRRTLWAIDKATETAITSMKRTFPIGAHLVYRHGRNWINAQVIEHGYGLSLKVKGQNSGKAYWIHNVRRLV